MNSIRIAAAIIFAILGIVCVAVVSLSVLTTNGVATQMNTVFFQPKADAAANRLVEKEIFTKDQHQEIRDSLREIYILDCITFVFAMGAITFILGISLLLIAYSLWMSVQLSILSQRLESKLADVPAQTARPQT